MAGKRLFGPDDVGPLPSVAARFTRARPKKTNETSTTQNDRDLLATPAKARSPEKSHAAFPWLLTRWAWATSPLVARVEGAADKSLKAQVPALPRLPKVDTSSTTTHRPGGLCADAVRWLGYLLTSQPSRNAQHRPGNVGGVARREPDGCLRYLVRLGSAT